jgi:hypothetical protein
VLPASFQAAVIGSGLTLAWIAAAAVIADGLPDPVLALQMTLATIMVAFIPIIVATVFCAIYIGVVGVPIAAWLGARLETPTGLAVAVGAALATGLAAMAIFGFRPLLGEVDWQFALMVFAYALPAGLLYRRAVLNARLLSPYAGAAA